MSGYLEQRESPSSRTLRIGLTGSIGVGKSKVFSYLKQILKERASYIDADEITHELYAREEVQTQLFSWFATCERKEISKLVFEDPAKMQQLNTYMQGIVVSEIQKRMSACETAYVLVDVPLLYELHLEALFDKIIVVYAPYALQLERICQRNHLSPQQAQQRIATQLDIERKKAKADYVIDNTSTLEHLYLHTLERIAEIVPGISLD